MSEGLRKGKRESESTEKMISRGKCICREDGEDTKNKCRSIGLETKIEPFPLEKEPKLMCLRFEFLYLIYM